MHKLRALHKPISLALAILVVVGMGIFNPTANAETKTTKPVINCFVAPCYPATVTSPALGETWQIGKEYKITWDNYSEYGDSVSISIGFYDKTVPARSTTITKETKNNGAYTWKVPTSLDSQLLDNKVVVNLYFPGLSKTVSSSPFSISKSESAKTLVVTSPKAGSEYGYNTKNVVPIRWSPSTVRGISGQIANTVTITLAPVWYCPPNPMIDCPTMDLAPYTIGEFRNNGEYNWPIPTDLSERFLNSTVQISVSIPNLNQYATSGSFTIFSTPNETGLNVTSPVAGSQYTPKQVVPIRWNSGTLGDQGRFVRISLVPSPECLDAIPACAIKSVAPYVIKEKLRNRGAYSWTIPKRWNEMYTGQMKILVEVIDGNQSGLSGRFNLGTTVVTTTAHDPGSLVLGLDNEPTSVSLIVKESDGLKRMVFPSGEVFMSQGYKWSKIVPGNKEDQALPVIGGFTLAPGTLVKPLWGQNPRTVYLVTSKDTLRPFADSDTFINWGYKVENIMHVPYQTLSSYTIGEALVGGGRHVDGTDVVSNGKVYFIENGKLRPYQSTEVYNSWHTFDNDYSKVVQMNLADKSLPIGDAVVARYYPN